MINDTMISRDLSAKRIRISRAFNAPVGKVWRAWTDAKVLDTWWAPKPWRAETKTMDFRVGGMWLYQMVGPDGTGMWCRVDFKTVVPQKSFTSAAVFSDESGNTNPAFPTMYWLVQFDAAVTGTQMEIEVSFDSEDGMQKMVEMGFEGGFKMGLGNLDEVLEGN
jgi:uncharacterized protein YndB with AHSA1/START domain